MTTSDNGFDVYGAIEAKWLQLGGPGGPLGHPVGNEEDTTDRLGRAQSFQAGMVSWHRGAPDGAFATYGLICERWLAIGREAFGYPITDEAETGDNHGRFNNYRGYNADGSIKGDASIFFLPGAVGAHEVYGGIRDRWAQMGWERSPAGYPISAERDRRDGPGREQQFQHGRFIWTAGGGAIFDSVGLPPILHLAAIDGKAVASGEGFTPGAGLDLTFTAKSAHGGTNQTEQRHQFVTTDGNGAFFRAEFAPTSTEIVGLYITTTDPATGQKASAAVEN